MTRRAGRYRGRQWWLALPTLKPLLLQWQQAMTAMSLRLLRWLNWRCRCQTGVRSFVRREAQRAHQTDPLPRAGRHRQRTGRRRAQDSGFLSFLLQDAQKELQVEVSEGQWIDARPREKTPSW